MLTPYCKLALINERTKLPGGYPGLLNRSRLLTARSVAIGIYRNARVNEAYIYISGPSCVVLRRCRNWVDRGGGRQAWLLEMRNLQIRDMFEADRPAKSLGHSARFASFVRYCVGGVALHFGT
eukprot:gene26667-32078_t